MANSIRIIEVGPRDGLQNEAHRLSLKVRKELVLRLGQAGLNLIEVGAFVSSKWVPQMQESGELIAELFESQRSGELGKKVRISALVPNFRGMEDAVKTELRDIAIFGACSEGFSKKNINCSIAESFDRFRQVIKEAKTRKIKVRGYLSTAFGCPYDGYVDPGYVVKLATALLELGVYEVSIGDTIGVASPRQVEILLKKILKKIPARRLAMHFHDTRGTALANVAKSYELGIRSFDSSVGGLGGCPYAKGASGNLATEDLVYMMHAMGVRTNVDLESLIETKRWIEPIIGRRLLSHVGQAGLPLAGTIR
ncbi:MAG: hydroxymethylglutaryl-CoA lyase [Bdellovibrionales bacterium]|nr:hydroxymethylglutaryl-CoA lyase [Bdellovibrionales bacterium]